jgi:surface antigen
MSYAYGNCTYYVGERFPQMSQNLGNAKDWLANAKRLGYPTLTKPAPDTVVVYGPGPSRPNDPNSSPFLGHVAVVDSVNADGSFQVTEMNWNAYDVVDQRRSTMANVLGFFVPPGSSYSGVSQGTSGSGNTVPNAPFTSLDFSIFGQQTSINLDPLVGGAAMLAGGLLMLAGVAVLVMHAFKDSKAGQMAAGVATSLAAPEVAVAQRVSKAATAKPAPEKPAEPTPAQQAAASKERVAVARARVPKQTIAERSPGVGYSGVRKAAPVAAEEVAAA